ncbi:MAG: threonylcarbamoyl-AMP synthase [Saccharofermentans sp.]|nr:threonylcarbamoyl-AMP synthase [Saccharofermentans sp.]
MERQIKYDNTLLIKGNDEEGIRDCAMHLKDGETVAFPTETVYGLGANAFDAEAVKRIFEAKGRPGDNPLICHIANKDQIQDIVSEVTPLAEKLIDAFMPGPITIIMKKSEAIPDTVTAGLDTVGVRMPSDKTANLFLAYCGVPVAAPSANLSGSPSPTDATSVMEDMEGYIYACIDGGDSTFGLESTVVDCTGEVPVILRPGAVTEDAIMEASTKPAIAGTLEAGATPKAPGMKYRHYAPVASVEVMDMPKGAIPVNDDYAGAEVEVANKPEAPDFKELDDDAKQELVDIAAPFVFKAQELLKNKPLARIGIYCGIEVKLLMEKMGDKILLNHTEFFCYGNALDVRAASHSLFTGLRHLDMQEVDLILAQGFEGKGLTSAYMNRLKKASGREGQIAPGMPAPSRPQRRLLPLEFFKDTYTSSVLFVCDDNTCMSPCLEAIMRNLLNSQAPYRLRDNTDIGCEIYCESAGLSALPGSAPDPDMASAVKAIASCSMSGHKAMKADPACYDANDLILTLKDEQAFFIARAFPQIEGKVFSLSSFAAYNGIVFKSENGKVASISVPDPRGENMKTYEHTVSALKAWLELLFPYILKFLGSERC